MNYEQKGLTKGVKIAIGILVAFLLLMIVAATSGGTSKEDVATKVVPQEIIFAEDPGEQPVAVNDSIPAEHRSALESAEYYANVSHMSKKDIFDQLTSEYGGKFTKEAAQYAIDNVDANWKENALISARYYQDKQHMSPAAIRDQLMSEHGGKFTAEEADYAVKNLSR